MKRLLPILLAIILTVVIFTGCSLFNTPDEEGWYDDVDTVRLNIGDKKYFKLNIWVRLDSLTMDDGDTTGCAWLTIKYPDTTLTVSLLKGESCGSGVRDMLGGYNYYSIFCSGFGRNYFGETLLPGIPYAELVYTSFYRGPCVDKPNIYLYPTKKTRMTVSLELPKSGKVTESIPAYPKKWKNIRVKPDGTINRKYDFLFYEADIPGNWQYDKGWSVAQKDLKFFFQNNLRDYGFNKKEIKDFTDWWIPRLKDHPYYEIYPQHTAKIENIIPLKINKEFDSLLRLFYFVDSAEFKRDLPEPKIPEFDRDGFIVTEWGVSLRSK